MTQHLINQSIGTSIIDLDLINIPYKYKVIETFRRSGKTTFQLETIYSYYTQRIHLDSVIEPINNKMVVVYVPFRRAVVDPQVINLVSKIGKYHQITPTKNKDSTIFYFGENLPRLMYLSSYSFWKEPLRGYYPLHIGIDEFFISNIDFQTLIPELKPDTSVLLTGTDPLRIVDTKDHNYFRCYDNLPAFLDFLRLLPKRR